jgi:hypothetical protein
MKELQLLGGLTIALTSFASGVLARWVPPPSYSLYPSANGRYFAEANGTPFFWQADTAWLLTHRLNLEETQAYLEDRASKGYNIVLNVGFTQIGIDSPNRNGDLTFHNGDISRPNEPYWAYVDSIVKLAWEKYNIRMAMIPAWGAYAHDGVNPGVFTPSNARGFGEFIGKRYPYLPKFLFADTNPLWADQNSIVNGYTRGGIQKHYPSVDFRSVYDAMAQGIVHGERDASGKSTYEPLLTMHPRNQWMPDAPVALASANLGDRDYLTFDASQSGHVFTAPHPPIPWWNAKRGWEAVESMYNASSVGRRRPVLDNEAHYELRWADADKTIAWNTSDVRTGSWQAAFCGAAGITYGDDNVMQMYVPGLFDPAQSGIVKPWNESIHSLGSSQMQYIRKAILDRGSRSFFSRVPAQDIILGDPGKCRNTDKASNIPQHGTDCI